MTAQILTDNPGWLNRSMQHHRIALGKSAYRHVGFAGFPVTVNAVSQDLAQQLYKSTLDR
jgi:hypothetical protein